MYRVMGFKAYNPLTTLHSRRATMLVRGSTRDVRFWHLSDMAKRTLDR